MIYILAPNRAQAMDYARRWNLRLAEYMYVDDHQRMRGRRWNERVDQIVELRGFRDRNNVDEILAIIGFMTFGASSVTWCQGEDPPIAPMPDVDLHDPEELARWLEE